MPPLAPAAEPSRPGAIQNPLLRQAWEQLEGSLAPKTLENFNKILIAGMKAGLANGPQGILAGLRGRPDPIKDCALGAVNLVLYLRRLARGTMPVDAMVPAAQGLMLQALDFADTAGIVEVGKPELANATRILMSNIFQAFQITPDMLTRAAEQTGGVIDNPDQLAALRQQVGQKGEG